MINRKLISKSIQTMLGLNYRKIPLGLFIKPSSIEWYFAVSNLNDKDYNWTPKVIIFNDKEQEVGIWNGLNDRNPVMVKAATIVAMAEQHIQKPM